MYYYHFHQWLSFFYFYCLFGWCFESTYVSLAKRQFVNRGFMKGPWLPLYGTGAICVLFVTLPFQDNPVLVYFVGAVCATILEYIVGSLMVALFKVRYWDYSYRKIQLHGHICLVSTIAWGFLSLLMVYVVHTPVARFILNLNNDLVSVVTFIITVLMVFDFANSFRRAMDLRNLIIQAEKLKNNLAERIELQKELVKSGTEEKLAIMRSRADYSFEYYSDQLKDKKAELQAAFLEQKYDTFEQIAQFEWMIEREIYEMKQRKDNLIRKMQDPATYEMRRNPGFKAPSLKKEFSKYKKIIGKDSKK
ncbi:MAG: putative ABC transporter permease [Lachnospiraceae bacterium]|nr:putative ABC transporter permease [Lachnospiraceae bacterium]